ncbi:MAG: hypothetical protein M0036_19170 [Desulfobacteraceae bacterium]|nr:hypothetical protein [Desulfobacteraceae bacterium]
MKKISCIALAMVVVLLSSNIAGAIELGGNPFRKNFKGVYTSPVPAVGEVTQTDNPAFVTITLTGYLSEDGILKTLDKSIAATVNDITVSLINQAEKAGYNALIAFNVDVDHSFSLHGGGSRINGSDGLVVAIVSVTTTPAIIK